MGTYIADGWLQESERLDALSRVLDPTTIRLFEGLGLRTFLWTDVGTQPIHPERYVEPYFHVWREAVAYMKRRGFDVHWGRHLASFMKQAGLVDVAGEVTAPIGNPYLALAMRVTVQRLGPALVASQLVSEGALAEFEALMSDPKILLTGSPTFSVWGRRPPPVTP